MRVRDSVDSLMESCLRRAKECVAKADVKGDTAVLAVALELFRAALRPDDRERSLSEMSARWGGGDM